MMEKEKIPPLWTLCKVLPRALQDPSTWKELSRGKKVDPSEWKSGKILNRSLWKRSTWTLPKGRRTGGYGNPLPTLLPSQGRVGVCHPNQVIVLVLLRL